jgi:hypothetical protein
VPLKFNWTTSDGIVVDSATVSPALSVYVGNCAADGASATLIVPDDAGQSDGWRYDVDTRTWIFGWNTRPLATGCYWIQITTSDAAFPAPTGVFPIVLRDR